MKKISLDSNSDLVSDEILVEISRQKEIDLLCGSAIRFIGLSRKSSGKITGHLLDQGVDNDTIAEVLDQLKQRGYLHDAAIAARIVRQRSGRRAVSASACRYYLSAAGLPTEVIEEAMLSYPSDEQNAQEALKGKFSSPQSADKLRMLRFLASRGFSSALAIAVVNRYIDSCNNFDTI